MTNLRRIIRAYLELAKIKISFFAASSAASGYFLTAGELKVDFLLMTAGVFTLACGSSAFNQYQERYIDAHMGRTKNRPVPSKRITPLQALFFSIVLMFSGLVLIFLTSSVPALMLGLLATSWYNGLYTYLKKKTAFAVIPGAFVGAIPPAIGWVSGGGALIDMRLLAFCFFFLMWQVPHFWIVLLRYGNEYKEAGLPSLSDIFSMSQLTRITSHWIFATAVSCMFLSIYGLVHTPFMGFMLLMPSSWLLLHGIIFMRTKEAGERKSFIAFKKINYYMLSIIILMLFDRITYAWVEHGLIAFIK